MPAAGGQADHDRAGYREADRSGGDAPPAPAAPRLGEQRAGISRAA
jgi:hypothetical protein